MSETRRTVLKTLTGVAAGAAVGRAAPALAAEKVTIVAHAVHRQAATTGQGGDITASWRDKNGASIEWLTFGVGETNERTLKEASLAQGSADIGFMLDRYAGPQYANLFEDLNEWQAKDPIPDFAGIPGSMKAAHTFGGKLTAMPFRHATQGFFCNNTLLAERGVAPPKTVEEMPAIAERLTYERPDGTKVSGLVIAMDDPAAPLDWIRGFGGDFITADYKPVCDSPATVRGVTVLRELYVKGVLPRNAMSMMNEDVTTFMQQGRAAMTNNAFGRYAVFNDAKASKFPGQIAAMRIPLAVDGKYTPAKTSVWAMAIPRNARNKALSWSLVKYLSTPENTVLEALNGNGPVRPAAYDDPRVEKLIPYAMAEKAALAEARLVIPGFPNAARAMDLFMEEFGLALLGRKPPQEAMADLRKRVQPLLPA
jgi:multiple sugar transport system substrate-binding protein